jgi:hypothetical protein
MTKILGRLERVDLRQIWATEDRDFTPWLAREEHLELLAETIGMDLELEAQEKDVGPFRADILCKNRDDDSWVLIENQIERTDHKHLGQLLTYAAGLKAVTIVWVASKFTEEHRAALDWLNQITDDNFRFFGLEVELWRIDDSPAAPKFNIISKPNNWSKFVSQVSKQISEQGITETKELQYRYWDQLVNFLQDNNSNLRPQNPRPRHWQNFSIGRSGLKIAATINTRDKRIGVELYMQHPEYSKAFFHLLMKDKDKIEQDIGFGLDWQELPEKTASRIVIYKQADPTDEKSWPAQYKWFQETIEGFDRVFRQRVRNLNPEQWNPEEAAA